MFTVSTITIICPWIKIYFHTKTIISFISLQYDELKYRLLTLHKLNFLF